MKKLSDSSHEFTDLDTELEVGRGQIKDNALKAVVTSKLFRARVEKAKKAKEVSEET